MPAYMQILEDIRVAELLLVGPSQLVSHLTYTLRALNLPKMTSQASVKRSPLDQKGKLQIPHGSDQLINFDWS